MHQLRFIGENPITYRRLVAGDEGVRHPAVELVTMRSERKPYADGDRVEANFGDENVPPAELVVVVQVTQKIKDIHQGIALLDGQLDHADIVQMMSAIYNREFTLDDEITYTLFVPAWVVTTLSPELQSRLLNAADFYQKDDEVLEPHQLAERVITDKDLAGVFFPAFFYWLTIENDVEIEDYPAALAQRGIIDGSRAAGMQELWREHRTRAYVDSLLVGSNNIDEARLNFLTKMYIEGKTAAELQLR